MPFLSLMGDLSLFFYPLPVLVFHCEHPRVALDLLYMQVDWTPPNEICLHMLYQHMILAYTRVS